MSGVPSAFIFVLVEVLVVPEGMVMVLDWLMVAWFFVEVDDLLRPAGLLIVLDFVVTFVPGVWVLVVVVFDELLLIEVAGAGAGVAAGAWARAAELPSKLREMRKPNRRFIRKGRN